MRGGQQAETKQQSVDRQELTDRYRTLAKAALFSALNPYTYGRKYKWDIKLAVASFSQTIWWGQLCKSNPKCKIIETPISYNSIPLSNIFQWWDLFKK